MSNNDQRTAAVSFRDVSKSFGSRKILDGLTFDVPKAGSVALLGRSGTGKSVTLKLIVGLLAPDAGSVRVLGKEVSELPPAELSELRRHMGFLFQNSALFDSISVGENVAFPLRRHTQKSDDEIRARVDDLLAKVRLKGEYDKMPADLSGGMKKRAALARAMVAEPDILLADEPSAGLDPITSEEIDDLLLSLQQEGGTTLVVVTHNIPSARRIVEKMILLDQGTIRAQGTADELAASEDETVQHFLRSQTGG